MAEFNWSAGLSTAGTVMETGANIYLALQQGEINAIKTEMKIREKQFGQDMLGLDRRSKIDDINLKHQEEIADLSKGYEQYGEEQMMQAMVQGRTMDSLASVQFTDQQQYIGDQATSGLNKQGAISATNTEYKLDTAMNNLDISELKASADLQKSESIVNASKAGLEGLTTLAKNNAFDSDYYNKRGNKAGDKGAGDSESLKKTYKTKAVSNEDDEWAKTMTKFKNGEYL